MKIFNLVSCVFFRILLFVVGCDTVDAHGYARRFNRKKRASGFANTHTHTYTRRENKSTNTYFTVVERKKVAIFNRVTEKLNKTFSQDFQLEYTNETLNCPNSTQYADDDVVKSSSFIHLRVKNKSAETHNTCLASDQKFVFLCSASNTTIAGVFDSLMKL